MSWNVELALKMGWIRLTLNEQQEKRRAKRISLQRQRNVNQSFNLNFLLSASHDERFCLQNKRQEPVTIYRLGDHTVFRCSSGEGGGVVLVVGSRGDHMVWGLRLRLNIGAFIHRNDADVLFHLSKNVVL